MKKSAARWMGWISDWIDAFNRTPFHGYMLFAVAFVPVLFIAAAHAVRYDFLCDDAFISFRYARNLIDGKGLVFNVGERVEGYTNFLWVMETAALWKIFGIVPEISSRILSYAATFGTYALVLLFALNTPFRRDRWFIAWWAVVCLALNRTFAVWASSGLETRQFTFFIVLAFYLFQFRERRPRLVLGTSLSFAAAALTRPEGIQIWAVFCFCYVLEGLIRKRLRADFLLYLSAFVVPVGLHFLFRYTYYGDWVPNTYYAKFVRPWPEAGFAYYVLAAAENGLYLWVPLALVGVVARLRLARDSSHAVYLATIVAYSAAMGRVGGDHFEYRLLDFYWPFLALASVEGAFYLVFLARSLPRKMGVGSRAFVGALIMLPLIYMGATQWAKYCASYEFTTRQETMHLSPRITKEAFSAAFLLPGMEQVAAVYNASLEFCVARDIALTHTEHKVFWQTGVARWTPYANALAERPLPKEVITAFETIGVYAYVLKDVQVVDLLGLTDAYVARLPTNVPNKLRHMAHDRVAPVSYQRSRGVNMTIYPACTSVEEALNTSLGTRIFPYMEYAVALPGNVWMPFEARFVDQTRADVATLFAGWEVWTRKDPSDPNSPAVPLALAMRDSAEPLRKGINDTARP